MSNRIGLMSLAIIALMSLVSCSPNLRPFTQQMYEQNRWSDDELRRIQFYLSNEIVLRREIVNGGSEIVRGQIKMVDGRNVEEIVIRKGTPGAFLFSPKNGRLAVSFEDGSDQRYLIFGPNPKAGERFVLMASDWNRNDGVVTYEEQKYRVDVASAYAGLMVDLKKLNKISRESRVVGGRKVN